MRISERNMKVLLLKPHFKGIYGNLRNVATEYPPLGLMYISSCIKQSGNDVKIVDMSVYKLTDIEYKNILLEYRPDIVGFTVTTPLSRESHRLAEITRQTIKDVRIIFGGPHPSAMPGEELNDPNVDCVVRGEGEIIFSRILDQKFERLSEIDGISYVDKGKIIYNPPNCFIENLDAIPFPSYELIDIKKYYFVDARRHPLAPILTSRGCPYGCIYCNKNIFGSRYRYRSARNVVDEIEYLQERYNVKEIHILDDGFTILPERVLEICDEIEKRKIEILLDCANGIRANTVNEKLLARMKDIGFYKIAFGIESGDSSILKNIKKGITLEQVQNAVKISKKVGLEVWGFFMIGLPGESRDSIEKTVKLAIDLDLDMAKFYITTPLPGTALFEDWKSKGYIKDFDWSKYSFYNKPVYEIPDISSSELLEIHKYCFRKFYFRPKYLTKKMMKISSFDHLIQTTKAGWSIFRMSRS